MIRLWTDGSVLVNPGGPGGWAFVAEIGGTVLRTASGASPETTNNRMELSAAIAALEWVIHRPGRIEVVSDSEYVVKGMRDWRFGWKRRGWRKVKNPDLWRRLDALVEQRGNVEFRWVRGHAGERFNEEADRIAGEAARLCSPPDPVDGELDAADDHLAELAVGWAL